MRVGGVFWALTGQRLTTKHVSDQLMWLVFFFISYQKAPVNSLVSSCIFSCTGCANHHIMSWYHPILYKTAAQSALKFHHAAVVSWCGSSYYYLQDLKVVCRRHIWPSETHDCKASGWTTSSNIVPEERHGKGWSRTLQYAAGQAISSCFERHNRPMIIWWLRTAVAMFVGPETTLTLTLTSGSRGQYGTTGVLRNGTSLPAISWMHWERGNCLYATVVTTALVCRVACLVASHSGQVAKRSLIRVTSPQSATFKIRKETFNPPRIVQQCHLVSEFPAFDHTSVGPIGLYQGHGHPNPPLCCQSVMLIASNQTICSRLSLVFNILFGCVAFVLSWNA